MAGHEEQDVGGRGAAGIAQWLQVRHDVQGAPLVDQAGVESCYQVADQQDWCRSSAPHFQIGQRYPFEGQGVDYSQFDKDFWKDAADSPQKIMQKGNTG